MISVAYCKLAARNVSVATCLLLFLFEALGAEVWLETNTNRRVQLYDHSRALLIGQSVFGAGWNELPHVPADLIKLRATFESQGFEVTTLQNLQGRDIFPAIQEFVGTDTGTSTRTIVYVTGHGWSDSNGVTYLVGSDAELPNSLHGPQLAKMLPVTALKDLHLISRSLHTLLILDSCYSGAILQTKSAVAPTRLVVEQMKKPVFQILASGQKNQRVAGDSTFADLFTAGLQGSAAQDRERKFVTFRQLANWLFFELPKRSNQVPVYADFPSPDGDMVFLIAQENLSGVYSKPLSSTTVSLASQVEAVQRTQAEQSNSFRSSFPTTAVFYYRKPQDDFGVVNALNKLGADYVARPAELQGPLKTNALGCGPSTPLNAIKSVAKALIKDGVPLSRITPYKNPSVKNGRIEVFSAAYGADPHTKQWLQNLNPLSMSEVDGLKSCRNIESKR